MDFAKKLASALSAATCIAAIAAPAAAQAQTSRAPESEGVSADEGPGNDIIVTARKREESLINVPVAVTALASADIERYSATDLNKIAQLAPQVIATKGQSGGGASFVIRGLGSSSGDPALEQSVSVNIDGVQVGRGRVLALGQFDIQQVEIMKGPQALYFGRNSPAGVISVTSVDPTSELSGYVKAAYEFNARERILEGAISGAIAENLTARLALRGSKMDGWTINQATAGPNPFDARYPIADVPYRRLPRTNEVAGRLTVKYAPSADTDVTLKVLAGRSNEGALSGPGQTLCFAPSTAVTTLGVVNPGSAADCKLNKYTQYNFVPIQGYPLTNWPGLREDGSTFAITKTVLSSLTINHKLGNLDFTSVTGYFDLNYKGAGQTTVTPLPGSLTAMGERTKTFSQEFRLNSDYSGPLNFTLGAFYSKNKLSTYNATALYALPIALPLKNGVGYYWDRRALTEAEVLSGFGQLRWKVVDQVEIAGGVRYTHEKKDGSVENIFLQPGATAGRFPEGVPIENRRRENNWSPEATVTWKPAPNHTIYAAYKTGYKSGGISQPTPVPAFATQDILDFEGEKIKGGELGYKAALFGRTVRLDIVAYTYKVTNLQTVAFDAVTVLSYLTNAGVARTRGIEASVNWQVNDQFQLRGQVGYNDAKYLSFTNSPCYLLQTAAEGCVGARQDLTGRALARAPKLAFMVGASYDQPIGNDLSLGIDVDLSHSGSYFRQENLHPFSLQEGYELLNAAIRLGQVETGWELSLQGRNLTNKYYAGVSVDQPFGGRNQFFAYPSRPREVILQASYRF